MTIYKINKSLLFVVSAWFLTCCSVEMKNHTPADFPYDVFSGIRLGDNGLVYSNDYEPNITMVSGETKTPFRLIAKLEDYPKHRFYLSTIPGRLANIRSVFVVINSEEFRMTPYPEAGKKFWYYEVPAECVASYPYHFKVVYKSGLFGREKVLKQGDSDFTARVDKYGEVNNHHNLHKDFNGYFRPIEGLGFNYTGEFAVNINLYSGAAGVPIIPDEAPTYSRVIKLQNLSEHSVKIDSVFLDDNSLNIAAFRRPDATFNNDAFSLEMDETAFPVTLKCGEYYYVKVKWNNTGGIGDSYQIDGAIGISSSYVTGPYTGNVAFSVTKMIYAGNYVVM